MGAYDKTLRYYGSTEPKDTCLKGCDAVLLVSSIRHFKGQNIKIFW